MNASMLRRLIISALSRGRTRATGWIIVGPAARTKPDDERQRE